LKPALCTDGYAGWTNQYDERGYVTQSTCLGTDGRPIDSAFGYAIVKYGYDDRGNCIGYLYYKADGSLITGN
jgi:hypothetical protein